MSDATEVAGRADFSYVRYAQVWEDADVLREGLAIRPGDVCLSIASAGDNALAMLLDDPVRVIAVDLNPAQLACLALRIAAYRRLDHRSLLELIGSRPCRDRLALYRRCRSELDDRARAFWDRRGAAIAAGIGGAGKFERYFRTFRRRILPLIHSRRRVRRLLRPRPPGERRRFYDRCWDTPRWRLLFRIFFSRRVMGRFGRDPAFFAYVEGSVADRILARSRHALRELDPSRNPYLYWILTGTHCDHLPCALREEHFATIRDRSDRIEARLATVEEILDECGPASIDRANLSDIFEYMAGDVSDALLTRLVAALRPGGRMCYWNMLVPRSAPASLDPRLVRRDELADGLLLRDKAWFYSRFVVEERARR